MLHFKIKDQKITYNNDTNSTAPQRSSGMAPSLNSDQSLASMTLPEICDKLYESIPEVLQDVLTPRTLTGP